MPLAAHARTLALARYLRAAAPSSYVRRGGRLPRQQQPDAIRREYYEALSPIVRKQTKHLADARKELLSLLIEERREQGKMDAGDRARRAKVIVERAGRAAADAFRPTELEDVAAKFGRATSKFQREQLNRQAVQAIAIPLVTIEKPITDLIPGFVKRNVSLVKTVADTYQSRMAKEVSKAFETGMTAETLARRLVGIDDMSDRDAMRIARDQIGKLNADFNQARQESIGVESFIWRTMNDNRVRDSHEDLDGQEFQWDALPTGDDGEEISPGSEIMCRCYAEPVFRNIIEGL